MTASGDIFLKVVSVIDKNEDWSLNYLKEKRTGTWLVATPIFICGTFPSAHEFRNELGDRYGMKILNIPSHCDGCTS